MLKTEQIANAKFTPVSAGAYSADEVDNFLMAVAESYDQNIKEKNELMKKMGILADKVEKYRNDEDAIKLALLDARKTAESVKKNAEDEAAATKANAEAEASKSIEDARAQAKSIVDNARVAVTSLTERAQQEAGKVINVANAKANEIIANANASAEAIVGNSKKEYEFYISELEKIKEEAAKYKTTIQKLCGEQLDLVSSVPDYVPSAKPEFVAPEVPEIKEVEVPQVEVESIKLDDIPVAEDIPESLQINEEIPATEEIKIAEEIFDNEEVAPQDSFDDDNFESLLDEGENAEVADDQLDDLLGLFGETEDVASPELTSGIDDLMPDIPEFEDIVPQQADSEPAADDDLDLLGDTDAEVIADDDEDISSLFDSLFE